MRAFKYILPFIFTGILNISAQVYLDSSASAEVRAKDLLSRMTLDEKIGQMTQADHKAVKDLEHVKTYFIGSILSGGDSDPVNNSLEAWTDVYDSFQKKALETRLGIPIIYGIDAVHGNNNVLGTVIFPHNIGLGCTRNPELIEKAARATAIEVAATGINWTFAPCIAVPRDERWGRTYEGFGETPELARLFGPPVIRGYQGNSLSNPTSILACAKHYVGDGGTVDGIDRGDTEIDEETLREIHLTGYVSAIESGAGSIMVSYSSWNGKKMHEHKYLLTDVLKNELGFEGFVVSDYRGIDQLPGDYPEKVEKSINAGIDMVMVPDKYINFFNTLKSLVQNNKITIERIDDAVSRILKIKFQLGLFERSLADRSLFSKVGSMEHREIARQCVRESLVLLKKKDGVLPLQKNNTKIFVTGSHADNLGYQCGGWTIKWQGDSGNITTGTTIFEAMKKTGTDAQIIYSENGDFPGLDNDYSVVVIGETPYAEGSGDETDLNLPESDIQLIKKMKSYGKPVIVILITGRPIIIEPILHYSDVIMSAWLPGTEGNGITDVLFGDYYPKGLLSFTWPKNMEQIPMNFGDENYNPLFEYGFGITNLDNSPAGSSPELLSSIITPDGHYIELTFNKDMSAFSSLDNKFTVIKNQPGSYHSDIKVIEASAKEDDNTSILLKLNDQFSSDDVVSLEYVSGTLQSIDGGILQPFGIIEVFNEVTKRNGN
jgi:beta-glucosidase